MTNLTDHEREFINEAMDVKREFPQKFRELLNDTLGCITLINAINTELRIKGIRKMSYVNGTRLLKEFFEN